MKDVECPYCGHEQNIDHGDGYGYEEDEIHDQECSECEKSFGFYTHISFSYDPIKVPCFNGADHGWVAKQSHDWGDGTTSVFYRCEHCDTTKREEIKNDN